MSKEFSAVPWSPRDNEWESPNKSPISWEGSPSQGFCLKSEKLPDILGAKDQNFEAPLLILKARCKALCSNLQEIIQESHKSVLSLSTASCSKAGNFTNRCTVSFVSLTCRDFTMRVQYLSLPPSLCLSIPFCYSLSLSLSLSLSQLHQFLVRSFVFFISLALPRP
jgi:hypothetical protein